MPDGEAAFITPRLPEGEIRRALGTFASYDYRVLSTIRVLDY